MAGSNTLDAFLTFGNGWAGSKQVRIDGETDDVFEKDWKSSHVLQYEFGFKLDSSPGGETGAQSGETAMHAPELAPVRITKPVDTASPLLMQALTMGTIFDDVWLWQKKPGASKTKSGEYFWMIHLEEVNITDLGWTADADTLNETLTLTYQKIDVKYLPQLKTGALDQNNKKFGQYPLPGAKLSPVRAKDSGVPKTDDIVNEVLRKLADMGYKKK